MMVGWALKSVWKNLKNAFNLKIECVNVKEQNRRENKKTFSKIKKLKKDHKYVISDTITITRYLHHNLINYI